MNRNNKCPICNNSSVPCLIDRPDYEYGSKYRFNYFRCEKCLHVFANVPCGFDLSALYGEYSTHIPEEEKSQNRNEGKKADWDGVTSKYGPTVAKVLDFGCGNGQFLIKLKSKGFKSLYAYDFDPIALELAQKYGAKVPDLKLGKEKYDLIFLNHVIEHLENPSEVVNDLYHRLNSGGAIYIITPNNHSYLSRLFNKFWRGWETPRHINIFSPRSGKILAESVKMDPLYKGNTKTKVYTIGEMFDGIYHESFPQSMFNSRIGKLIRWSFYFPVKIISLFLSLFSDDTGEELVIVIKKI